MNIDSISSSPTWSSDSEFIYISNRENAPDLQSQLWQINISTSEAMQLTNDDRCYTDPRMDFDDNTIWFLSLSECESYNAGLYSYNLTTGDVGVILYGSILDFAYSSEKIITAELINSDDGYFSVLANFANGIRDNIASFTLVDEIALSSDEEQVAAVESCVEFMTSQIILVDIETKIVTEVTNCRDNIFASSQDWSPDSTRIVYQSDGDIWLYDVASTDHTNLTDSLR